MICWKFIHPKSILPVSFVCCWSISQVAPGEGDGLTDGEMLEDTEGEAELETLEEIEGDRLGLADGEREPLGRIDGETDGDADSETLLEML